jgi:hypothetical protein
LNLQTGLVSPQFHCSYDDLFETTTRTQARSIPKSQWQYKVGFVKETSRSTQTEGEQETVVIPFNTEMISPNVLAQLYEGGFEGDIELSEQYNDEDNNDEEEKDSPNKET